jgi:cell division septal protein FtsQ
MSDTTSPLRQFDGPRVDPRFRRRWAEARRAEGRRRLKILLSVLAVAAVLGGCIGSLFSPLFRVRDVIVIGNTHTPRAQVLAAAGIAAQDRTVLMVDAGPPSARRSHLYHQVFRVPRDSAGDAGKRLPGSLDT